MASPPSSPTHQEPYSDGLNIPDQHGASQTNFSLPNSVQENDKQALPRTNKRDRPAEEGWASKPSGEEEKAGGFVNSKLEVVDNLAVTAEEALEEADKRVDEAEAVTQNAFGSETTEGGGEGIVAEVAENAEVAVETAKLSVETAEVIVQGVETVSKAILLDADRLQSLLEQSETHEGSIPSSDAVLLKEKPKDELDADQLLNSVEQNVTHEANDSSRDNEPPKKKPKQEEEGVESS